MTVIKRILLTVFLAVTGLSLSAQEKPDSTAYRFRFVAENDMFFSPWSGNGQELERLLAAIDEHRPAIEAGQMYLLVTSYATDGNEEQTAAQVAKTRRNRVKSELIVRGKIKESNFVTDQLFDEAYTDGNGKSLHNMVIVTLPASVEKVAEIAGAEAAARVEAYNKEVSGEAERERMAAKEQAKAEQTAKEKAEQERIAAEQAAREKAEAERMERERMAVRGLHGAGTTRTAAMPFGKWPPKCDGISARRNGAISVRCTRPGSSTTSCPKQAVRATSWAVVSSEVIS